MRNQKHHIHSTTKPPSGVRWLDTALDTSRKRYTLLFPRISNTDALPTGLNNCDFTSSSLTKGLEVKSSTPTLLFHLPNLCVLKSRTARRVVKKQTT
ncbi:hypothetical protein N8778_01310 [Verrucomicrobia bacterium]|nr:hypothetical protein [Verrucomicrobiota bacterium]